MKIVLVNFVFAVLIGAVTAVTQHQETIDQFKETNHTEMQTESQHGPIHLEIENSPEPVLKNTFTEGNTTERLLRRDLIETSTAVQIVRVIQQNIPQEGFFTKLYRIISIPIVRFAKAPKVITVMYNIGSCLVNGAIEIVSFYFPAPLIPLIASAAGLVIPFEPVVLLRERMPVDSYRRAFQKAVTGFLGTFDKFKYDEEDPYMTRRFNRRSMRKGNRDDMAEE